MKTLTLSALALSALTLTACGGNTPKNDSQTAQKDTATDTTTGTTKSDGKSTSGKIELLNVSYDVARDFYKEYNPLFVAHYKKEHPDANIEIKQSHGGSSKQALSVKNGLEADVVTMNQGSDVELLADSGLVSKEWRAALPNNAIPFTSTVVFLVRDGNPKGVKDWNDLAKAGTEIVIANPKTTGNGRYAFFGGVRLWTTHLQQRRKQNPRVG